MKFTHVGEKCSFDAFIGSSNSTPGLGTLADIVRGADASRLDLAAVRRAVRDLARPRRVYVDDHEMLKSMVMYDALYAW